MKNICYDYIVITLLIPFILIHSCKEIEVPIISTDEILDISESSALCLGHLVSDGGETESVTGICWANVPEPTIMDNIVIVKPVDGSIVCTLSGLDGGLTYYIRAFSTNSAGTGYGEELSFTTLGQLPVAITLEPKNADTASIMLNGSVNANYLSTAATFEYGVSTEYGSSFRATPYLIVGNAISPVSCVLHGLHPGITYHFRLKTENSLGITYGEDKTFTTSGNLPAVKSIMHKTITSSAVSFEGIVNPSYLTTRVYFEYGLTTDYGKTVIATPIRLSGNSDIKVFGWIADLNVGTVYHCRIKASNSLGSAYSSDYSITTSSEIIEYKVGDHVNGGIVFYVSGQHGLVCAETDQSDGSQWGCTGSVISGANGGALWSGSQNTADIIHGCTTPDMAALVCRNYRGGGYNDWYLPSVGELQWIMYNGIGCGLIGIYWSSTQGGCRCHNIYWPAACILECQRDLADFAYVVNPLGIPDVIGMIKGEKHKVRAVRAF